MGPWVTEFVESYSLHGNLLWYAAHLRGPGHVDSFKVAVGQLATPVGAFGVYKPSVLGKLLPNDGLDRAIVAVKESCCVQSGP